MKKSLIIMLAMLLVLSTVFAACSSKETTEEDVTDGTTAEGLEDVDTEYGFETETVTDESGEAVTDESGNEVTTDVAVVYKVDEDGKTYAQKLDAEGRGVTDSKGKAVTVKTTYSASANEASQGNGLGDSAAAQGDNTASAGSDSGSGNSAGGSNSGNSGNSSGGSNSGSSGESAGSSGGNSGSGNSGGNSESGNSGGNDSDKTTTKKNNSSDNSTGNNTTTNKATTTEKDETTATTKKTVELTESESTSAFSGKEVVPKTSATGEEVSFDEEDQEIIASMLEVPYLYLENYENSQGVPVNTAVYTAVWMAHRDGGTSTGSSYSYSANQIVLSLFKYYGNTVVNFKTKCSNVENTPIKYNSSTDSFAISTFPEKKQSVTITKIEDLGNNNFYKVTGNVSNAGSVKKVVAVIQKNRLEPTLGFSIKALKWS